MLELVAGETFLCPWLMLLSLMSVTVSSKEVETPPLGLPPGGGGGSVVEVQHPGVGAPAGRRAVDAAAAAEPVEPPEQGVAAASAGGAMYMRVQRVRRRTRTRSGCPR